MTIRAIVRCAAVVFAIYLISLPVSAQGNAGGSANSSALDAFKKAASVPTPQTADGHPDLTGTWGGRGGLGTPVRKDGGSIEFEIPVTGVAKASSETQEDHEKKLADLFDDLKVAQRAKDPNKPPYKPDLLAKVQNLDENENTLDPGFYCKPQGIPRMGPPKQIVQSPGQVVFLYETSSGNYFRVIPTDGRPHLKNLDPMYMGDSVGHWEGDALVVDVIDLNDDTWLGPDGWFHSATMHVTERFTRLGNTLRYQATVEDPNVFTRPWTMNPRVVQIVKDNPIVEAPPCVELDGPHLVNKDHL